MNLNDHLSISGEYKFEGYDITGKKIFEKTFKNTVVQNFFTSLFKIIAGQTGYVLAYQMATGTGTNVAAKTDTTLQTEYYRKNVTSITYTTTQVIIKTVLTPVESNITIKEIGIFSSDGGLLSRCNVDVDKNSSTQYTITYTMTIT